MTMYIVSSWTLPKRRRGSYPVGYVSAAIDASTPKDAADRMISLVNDFRPVERMIEVKDGWSNVKTYFRLSMDKVLSASKSKRRRR